jgi:hypothetical protein
MAVLRCYDVDHTLWGSDETQFNDMRLREMLTQLQEDDFVCLTTSNKVSQSYSAPATQPRARVLERMKELIPADVKGESRTELEGKIDAIPIFVSGSAAIEGAVGNRGVKEYDIKSYSADDPDSRNKIAKRYVEDIVAGTRAIVTSTPENSTLVLDLAYFNRDVLAAVRDVLAAVRAIEPSRGMHPEACRLLEELELELNQHYTALPLYSKSAVKEAGAAAGCYYEKIQTIWEKMTPGEAADDVRAIMNTGGVGADEEFEDYVKRLAAQRWRAESVLLAAQSNDAVMCSMAERGSIIRGHDRLPNKVGSSVRKLAMYLHACDWAEEQIPRTGSAPELEIHIYDDKAPILEEGCVPNEAIRHLVDFASERDQEAYDQAVPAEVVKSQSMRVKLYPDEPARTVTDTDLLAFMALRALCYKFDEIGARDVNAMKGSLATAVPLGGLMSRHPKRGRYFGYKPAGSAVDEWLDTRREVKFPVGVAAALQDHVPLGEGAARISFFHVLRGQVTRRPNSCGAAPRRWINGTSRFYAMMQDETGAALSPGG